MTNAEIIARQRELQDHRVKLPSAIGNAVPADAATGVAEVMGETLLLAWSGETFRLSAKPIWVRPVAVAIAVRGM